MAISLAMITGQLTGQIEVSNNTLDYGKVAVWKNDTLVFSIKNRSATIAKLLPTYNPTTLLIGPKDIKPGQTADYKIVAYPAEKGYFEFRPTYYFSNSNNPVALVVKGTVGVFDDNALFQCPKLENKPAPPKPAYIKIQVVDEITNKPIYHSNIVVRGVGSEVSLEGSGTEIEANARKYTISVTAEGYLPKISNYIFTKNGDIVLVKLKPIVSNDEPEEKVVLEEEPIGSLHRDVLDTLSKKQAKQVVDLEEDITQKKEDKNVVEKVTQSEIKRNRLEKLTTEFANSNKPPQHVIILADVSFSMKRNGYLEELKTALIATMKTLRPIDSVSLITFSTRNVVLADHISARFLDSLNIVIGTIEAQGGTNAKIALKTAYGMADRYDNNTQIFLFTDGKFNTPGTSVNWYAEYSKERSLNKHYTLNIILFSNDETDYAFMQKVAINGKGGAFYINKWGIETLILEQLLNQ